MQAVPIEDAEATLRSSAESPEQVARRIDVTRAMSQLKPRERAMLWLAYALGASHEEIAAALGVKTATPRD